MGSQNVSLKSGGVYNTGERVKTVNIGVRIRWLPVLARAMSWIGMLMIFLAASGLIGVYIPLGVAEIRYAWTKSELNKLAVVTKRQLEGPKQVEVTTGTEKKIIEPKWDVPDMNYSIYIPKIEAISRVIGNVDAGDKKEYLAALQKGVAEAANLAHPGEVGTTYLFAHSVGSRVDYARYNAVFYLLDKVTEGDKIEIVYKGKLFGYEVTSKEILAADDTHYLIPQNLSEKLVLQTCYPPGTSWKRLIVLGKRIY